VGGRHQRFPTGVSLKRGGTTGSWTWGKKGKRGLVWTRGEKKHRTTGIKQGGLQRESRKREGRRRNKKKRTSRKGKSGKGVVPIRSPNAFGDKGVGGGRQCPVKTPIPEGVSAGQIKKGKPKRGPGPSKAGKGKRGGVIGLGENPGNK